VICPDTLCIQFFNDKKAVVLTVFAVIDDCSECQLFFDRGARASQFFAMFDNIGFFTLTNIFFLWKNAIFPECREISKHTTAIL